jgi:hypothetical protein
MTFGKCRRPLTALALALAVVELAGFTIAAPLTSAQTDIEIIPKEDAAQVFAMTKQQWRDNLAAAVQAGAAKKLAGDAMWVRTPNGALVTRPVYSRTDVRPSRIEIKVVLDPPWWQWTEAMVKDAIDTARRQMQPEYAVDGRGERTADGVTFFFTLSETGRR